MQAKYLSIFASLLTLSLQFSTGELNEYGCFGDFVLDKTDCSTALQYSIPKNGENTGGLHATVGGCKVNVETVQKGSILKTTVSKSGTGFLSSYDDCCNKAGKCRERMSTEVEGTFGNGRVNITW